MTVRATVLSSYLCSYFNFLVILLLFSYTVLMLSYSECQTLGISIVHLIFAACPLAFSIEDDYSTGLHWCSCHGRTFHASLLCVCLLQWALHCSNVFFGTRVQMACCYCRFADAYLSCVDRDLLIVVQCLLSVKLELIFQILRLSSSGVLDIPNNQLWNLVIYVGNANIFVFSLLSGTFCPVGGAPAWSSCSGAAGCSDFDCKCLLL